MSDLVENAPHPDITYRIVGAAMAQATARKSITAPCW